MAEPAKKKVGYDALYDIPENITGEIIDGELILTPRPTRKHAHASFALGSGIGPFYGFGRGNGSGGWIFLFEPEIELGKDILVPDLAGWKKERFPRSEEHNWISVAPDWVCEILSPSTARLDKVHKMRIYARQKVRYAWLTDPILKTLEVFRLESDKWLLLDVFSENDKVRAEPFQDLEIELGDLWLD